MRAVLIFALLSSGAGAVDVGTLIERALNKSLTGAQRNDACYELRGNKTPDALKAARQMLADEAVRACGAKNLFAAGEKTLLLNAIEDQEPDVRSIAAHTLGALKDPEMIPALASVARDPVPLVALSGLQALSVYDDPAVAGYLLEIGAKRDGVGLLALEQALRFREPKLLPIARELVSSKEIPQQLTALRILGDLGDATDLPALKKLAAKEEPLTANSRGFGLMPVISIARVARASSAKIEARTQTPQPSNTPADRRAGKALNHR